MIWGKDCAAQAFQPDPSIDFRLSPGLQESRGSWQTRTLPANNLPPCKQFAASLAGLELRIKRKTGSLKANGRPIVNTSIDVVLHSQSGKNFYTLGTPGVPQGRNVNWKGVRGPGG